MSRFLSFVLRDKFLFFCSLFGSFMTMGFVISMMGPSLLELSEQTNSNLSGVVFLLSARSIGFFVGTLFGGQLVDRFAHWGKTILFLSLAVTMVLTFITPLIPYLGLLATVCLSQGALLGCIDNVAQVLLIRIMTGDNGKEVQPYMQALHAAFGVGAFISPLIISPFLSGVDPTLGDDYSSGTTGSSVVNGTSTGEDTVVVGSTDYHYAYYLISLLILPISAAMAYYAMRDEKPHQRLVAWWTNDHEHQAWSSVGTSAAGDNEDEEDEEESEEDNDAANEEIEMAAVMREVDEEMAGTIAPVVLPDQSASASPSSSSRPDALSPTESLSDVASPPAESSALTGLPRLVASIDWVKWRMIIAVGVFLYLYTGTEAGYGGFIFTYGVKQSHMDPSHAAILNSAFWFSFALGRLLGIPMSLHFSAATMIFLDLIGGIISVLTILLFHDSVTILWIGTVTYGISVASIYPSAINFVDSKMKVNGQVLSALVVAASTGEASVPIIMGLSFESPAGPMGFMLLAMGVAVGAAIIFALIVGFIAPRAAAHDAAAEATAAEKKRARRRRKKHSQQQPTPNEAARDALEVELELERELASEQAAHATRAEYSVVQLNHALDSNEAAPLDDDQDALERQLDAELRGDDHTFASDEDFDDAQVVHEL